MALAALMDIQLDNQTGIFQPGSVVSGRVIAVISEPLTIRGFRVVFDGQSRGVLFSDDGSGEHKSSRIYIPEHVFFHNEVPVYGNPRTAPSHVPMPVMTAGRHTFPFSYQLPYKLPANYKSSIGSITYKIIAHIDRSSFNFDIKTEKEFKIPPFLDLNLYPNLLQPAEVTDQKTVCCLCCTSGPIVCTMRVMKTGFVAGELAPVWADIFNGSSKTIDKVALELVKVEKFHGVDTNIMELSEIGEVKKGRIRPSGSQRWVNEGVLIPPLSTAPPTIDETVCPNLK